MALNLKKIFGKKDAQKLEKKSAEKADTLKVAKSGKTRSAKVKPQVAKKPSAVIYKALKRIVVSEKTTDLNEHGQYTFLVAKNANKNQVKQAIQDLYGVKVDNVRVISLPGKPRTFRGHRGWRHGLENGTKKVIVSLAQGEKIEILPR
ncbi:MAG: 50S ribosomal protein L23 [Candidatus Portnoybacteria bacterium CG06_land_8_20_14_3_00_39_12]|uniref:Large ribosomal subunit protein uL23 n=3 Tax=Candidatus Portnoyibacteriota TaxID=1817913 RepID=A0A2M8KFV6_9BACT|nr:MAG: 50S ribosomal protein L23 [Candidatus Portnoybacteria bacterium CG06_land_8_20_14_3_00_39_12]PIZ70693.1 MAG: 50S ribosomal protein L23 [Candidatus Portnoybacteria bacterium CG_4_10_14_0_2_um_filter_39_11]PJE58799.1 MAG: 50S ribosomal protein L23 [Candidatus Portnoybacteria bacterium CG10_big_fil_rev_8_21_14_0_10_40_22]